MKRNKIGMFILFLFILVLTGSCSSMIKSVTDMMAAGPEEEETSTEMQDTEETVETSDIPENKDIAGEWINTDYDTDGRSAKLVYIRNTDKTYTYTAYDKSDGSGNVYTGTVIYLKRWYDDKGNLLGKSKVDLEGGMSWETLERISKDGKSLEVQSGVTEINPSGPRYSIYYRK